MRNRLPNLVHFTALTSSFLSFANWKLKGQKMVISGGDFKPDTLKPKEMVSLLLDDDEMETRCKEMIALHCIAMVE